MFAFQAKSFCATHEGAARWLWSAGALALVLSAALITGFATRVASALVALCAMGVSFSWLSKPEHHSLDRLPAAYLIVFVSIAIALIGPGAYSFDAHFFGFRQITIVRHSTKAREPE
jgi:uncharacterized membrane protein YphA (DoxX/SURF4 family)